jgi:hypothetical protein
MLALFAAVLALTPANSVTTIPLSPYLAYQATIVASVNGKQGTFLFDTGEGVTAITPDFAHRIGCRSWGRITGFRMTGERLGSPHCDDLSLSVANHALPIPSAIVLDINSLLGPGLPHVDGSIGLDAFAGTAITIVPRSCVILESPDSLARRTAAATPLPIRLVRDAEGVALSVDGAVSTSKGTAWMELDSGNGGSVVISNDVAPALDIPANQAVAQIASFRLANGILVTEPARTRDLIMDGNIGARFLNSWNITLDLANPRAWLAPKNSEICVQN